jgi:hypothetical protein
MTDRTIEQMILGSKVETPLYAVLRASTPGTLPLPRTPAGNSAASLTRASTPMRVGEAQRSDGIETLRTDESAPTLPLCSGVPTLVRYPFCEHIYVKVLVISTFVKKRVRAFCPNAPTFAPTFSAQPSRISRFWGN